MHEEDEWRSFHLEMEWSNALTKAGISCHLEDHNLHQVVFDNRCTLPW